MNVATDDEGHRSYEPTSAVESQDAATNAPLPLEVGSCADVLAQQGRWLKAITAGDVPTRS
jgi:hypothetical protein